MHKKNRDKNKKRKQAPQDSVPGSQVFGPKDIRTTEIVVECAGNDTFTLVEWLGSIASGIPDPGADACMTALGIRGRQEARFLMHIHTHESMSLWIPFMPRASVSYMTKSPLRWGPLLSSNLSPCGRALSMICWKCPRCDAFILGETLLCFLVFRSTWVLQAPSQ